MKDISDTEYETYKTSFDALVKEFGEETTFQDYHDYYLILDVVRTIT